MARLELNVGGSSVSGGGGNGIGTTSPLDDLCLKAVDEQEEDPVVVTVEEERSRGQRKDNTLSPRIKRNSVDLVIVGGACTGTVSSGVPGSGGNSATGALNSRLLEMMGGSHSSSSLGNVHHHNIINRQQRRIKVAKVVNGHAKTEPEPHIYEDIEPNGPPKITPISGVLAKGKVVIRPIAFKPVLSNNNNSGHGGLSSSVSSVTSGSRYNSVASTPVNGLNNLSSSSSCILTLNNSIGSRSAVVSRAGSTTSTLLAGNELSFGNSSYFSTDSLDKKSSSTVTLNSSSRYLSQTSIGSSLINGKSSNSINGHFLADVNAHSASSYSNDSCIKLSETPASYFSSSDLSHGSVLHLDDDFNQTPSPSDSGVAELEAMLKEKDSEINYLRETMEQNEQVIFKVYEEKELNWQRETKRLKAYYEGKLKTCQQRAVKMEQMLMMQTYQLQQEKKKLKQDCDKAKEEKESVANQSEELRIELESVRNQLEETEWTMCQKSGEISLLKSQLKDSQGDHTSRSAELVQLRAQLKESRGEAEERSTEVSNLREQVSSLYQELDVIKRHRSNTIDSTLAKNRILSNDKERLEMANSELRKQIDLAISELDEARRKALTQREAFELERIQWLEEKEKVIRYQKQLQLNYVQMYRRNRTLESEVEQLTLELDGRDLKLSNGESEC
ncbi:hypothetical protein CHUAL_011150 [Chamberlinius hualienensis]